MSDGRYSIGMTLAQRERLYLLIEEMAGATEAAVEVLRNGHGNPRERTRLEQKLGCVMSAIARMVQAQDVESRHLQQHGDLRVRELEALLHHQHGRRRT